MSTMRGASAAGRNLLRGASAASAHRQAGTGPGPSSSMTSIPSPGTWRGPRRRAARGRPRPGRGGHRLRLHRDGRRRPGGRALPAGDPGEDAGRAGAAPGEGASVALRVQDRPSRASAAGARRGKSSSPGSESSAPHGFRCGASRGGSRPRGSWPGTGGRSRRPTFHVRAGKSRLPPTGRSPVSNVQ